MKKQCVSPRVSPSGCPIGPDENVSSCYTYRVVRVGDRAFNEKPDGPTRQRHRTIAAALETISEIVAVPRTGVVRGVSPGAHYRIVEIPAGEPWDYDGEIYASIRIGRGVE